jgi:membrane protease YdiL (CAAX protease family)
VLRLAAGPSLPSFIPAAESSAPGFLLSMTAGYSEELGCRLVIMPLAFFALRERLGSRLAAASAVLVTGRAFALWHAAGEPDPSSTYFLTRLIIPGCAMSLVWLVSPSAIVCGHCAAHLLIPALFV